MAARPPAGGLPGASVTWAATADEASTARIGAARLTKVRRHDRHRAGRVACRPRTPRTATSERPSPGCSESAYEQEPSSAWVADVDGDGCPDVVAPMLWIGCGRDGPQRGPSWLATRPLALVGDGADRRVLVAARLDWHPYLGGGQGPRPGSGRPARRVADGWVVAFVLAEVPLATVTAASDAPVEAPTIGHAASRDGVIEIGWPAGTSAAGPGRPAVVDGAAARVDRPRHAGRVPDRRHDRRRVHGPAPARRGRRLGTASIVQHRAVRPARQRRRRRTVSRSTAGSSPPPRSTPVRRHLRPGPGDGRRGPGGAEVSLVAPPLSPPGRSRPRSTARAKPARRCRCLVRRRSSPARTARSSFRRSSPHGRRRSRSAPSIPRATRRSARYRSWAAPTCRVCTGRRSARSW